MTPPATDAPGLPPALAARVAACLAGPHARVKAIEHMGGRVWLKRPERPASLRWRLQKGDPARAFAREVAGLRALAARGVPVPRILQAGPDHMVLADAGPTVEALLSDPGSAPGTRAAAVAGAARALAGLHASGLVHGRPYLRDICWDGARITLIDLERFRSRSTPLRQGLDLVLFLASVLAHPAGQDLAAPALAELRAGAPPAALRAAGVWVGFMRLLAPAARLALRRRPKNREIAGYLRLVDRWPDLRAPG